MGKRTVRLKTTTGTANLIKWNNFYFDDEPVTVMEWLNGSIDKMTFAYFGGLSAQKVNIIATVLNKKKQVGTMRIVLSMMSVCTYAKRTKCCDMPFCDWRADEIKDLLSILPKESCISFLISYEDGSAEEHTWKRI